MAKPLRYRGRPSSLTEDVKDSLLFAIRRGLTLAQACDYAGIAYTTLRGWINRAEDEEARLAANDRRTPYKRELEYLQFKYDYEEAIADSRVTLADVIKLAADGGHTATEKTTRVKKELRQTAKGQKQLVITEETTIETVKVSLPDWRAALAMLERRDPENWSKRKVLEHIGDPDRPVGTAVQNPYAALEEEELNDRLDQLTKRINQKRKNRSFTTTGSDSGQGDSQAQGDVTGSEEETDN
jgi:hypothetical protein